MIEKAASFRDRDKIWREIAMRCEYGTSITQDLEHLPQLMICQRPINLL